MLTLDAIVGPATLANGWHLKEVEWTTLQRWIWYRTIVIIHNYAGPLGIVRKSGGTEPMFRGQKLRIARL